MRRRTVLTLMRDLDGPLLLQQQAVVLRAEGGLGVGPGAPVTRGISVTPTHSMSTCLNWNKK